MKWIKTTQRELSLFSYLCNIEGYVGGYKKYIGRNWKYFLLTGSKGMNTTYREENEYNDILKLVKKNGVTKLDFVLENLKKNCLKMDRYLKIYKLDNYSDKKILDLVCGFIRDFRDHYVLYLLPKYFGLVFSKMPKKIENKLFKLRRISYFDRFENEFLAVLFREIKKRKNIPYKLLFFATPTEVIELMKGKKLATTVLDKRSEQYAVVVKNGKTEIFSGKKAKEIEDKVGLSHKNLTNIQGRVAFPGLVTGKVVRVFKEKDLRKMKGKILVTPMTTINFVPYLKGIKAIVTDEGGIACHAAILAREFKIPTIIGTKIATQILKDGDKVEVDAEKGTVKRI